MRFFEINFPMSKKEDPVYSEIKRLDQNVPDVIISVEEDNELVQGLDEREAWNNVAEKWIVENFDDYSNYKPTAGYGGFELSKKDVKDRIDKLERYKDQLESALSSSGINEFPDGGD